MGVCALFVLATVSVSAVKQYTVEDFFRDPDLSGWSLSPDGKKMMVIAPSAAHDGARNIHILDMENPGAGIVRLTNESDHVINIGWFNNERIFYGTQREGRNTAGLWAVNIDGSRFRNLVKPVGASNSTFRFANVFDLYKKDDRRVLVISNEKRLNYPDVYLMDIFSGGKKIYASNPGNVVSWVADTDSVIRAGVELDTSTLHTQVIYRDSEDDDWEVIQQVNDPDRSWSPVGFLTDNKTMLVVSNVDSDTTALYKYDTTTREIVEKVHHDPEYDLGGVLAARGDDRFLGVAVTRDKPFIKYFDPKYAELQEILDASFPDTVNRISSISEDESIAVVTTFSDVEPGTWYKFDIENMKIEILAQAYSWLDREDMVEQKPFRFKARDGYELEGYLAMPKNYQGQPVPLIAVPHGGPWSRDSWPSFFTWTQFLANRGFAVLMVNFRLSSGYGIEHLSSGYKRPDIAYNDVIDAVDWAVEQGYADPDQLGVLGFSWGGTATMASIVFNPGKFNFGVAMAGQYDLPDGVEGWKSRGNELGTLIWRYRMGDPRNDEELAFMEKWSPINHIDKVDVPIYIYHGTKDINVDVRESRRLVSELRSHGHDPVVVYKKDEAHSKSIQKNRIDSWTQIDKFLEPFKPRPSLSMK